MVLNVARRTRLDVAEFPLREKKEKTANYSAINKFRMTQPWATFRTTSDHDHDGDVRIYILNKYIFDEPTRNARRALTSQHPTSSSGNLSNASIVTLRHIATPELSNFLFDC